ncbi:uncharacterized protein LOC129239445 [Anastrepha obliqua]|uniref:uncharacterized protein LOC129239445 n=1 Tax=Anastrepha obliqua TaxID=95512 RepID=UPI00240908D2|nr:uncharacterized protein LOC129239445 [Anastrepha obliqua]XP_054730910.1 uncharacterized protein LOC129239445 [Anastrepha obliqua]XP_054730911.1 uncharacterized protein LOC129239445 [Anastrepha obliqua]
MKFHQNEAKSEVQMLTPPPQGAGEGENVEDTPELLLKMLVDAVWKLWIQFKIAASFVMVDLGGYQLLDKMVQWCVRNPHKAICITAALLVFLLPFLIMLGIGLSTLLMTLTGFLVLEGILLSIVAALLMGCVGFLVLAVLFVKQLNRTA